MWPGRPPARRRTSPAADEQPVRGAEQQRGIEVALHCRGRARAAAHASSSGRSPVDADHVSAGCRHVRRMAAVPTPK